VTISKPLGHSSIAVTSRYLDHLTNAQAVTVLEQIDLPLIGGERERQDERAVRARSELRDL
jgi:hypothetical protein